MQSTWKCESKTHPEMLPQPPALRVSFDVPGEVTVQGVSYKHRRRIQRADGYSYTIKNAAIPPTAKSVGFLAEFL